VAKNIVLFGFMGSGKSSVGRIVARTFGMELLEMDDEIERREASSINDIFGSRGEAYFRECERRLVEELAGREGLVISTGGGVVLDERNIRDLGRNGVLICLDASPRTVLERTRGEEYRPLLNTPHPLEKIRELLGRRQRFYDLVPNHVKTDGRTVGDVAGEVLAILGRCGWHRDGQDG
jgi:shikimate kinase